MGSSSNSSQSPNRSRQNLNNQLKEKSEHLTEVLVDKKRNLAEIDELRGNVKALLEKNDNCRDRIDMLVDKLIKASFQEATVTVSSGRASTEPTIAPIKCNELPVQVSNTSDTIHQQINFSLHHYVLFI